MKKYDVLYENGFKLVEYYRNHPCIAAYDLLGIKLAPIQRVVLRDIWFKNYTIIIATRGWGKTFVLGLASSLQCLLYPGQRVGLISGTFRQAKKIFGECEKFYNGSYIMQEAVAKGPIHGSDSHRIEFKNVNGYASYLEALPLGDGCITNCNYLTFYDRFDKIATSHISTNINNHYVDRNEVVWGNNKYRKSDRSLCNGEKDTIKIKTKKGFKNEGTPNHQFKIVRDGEIVWCRLDDMIIGDRILIDKSYRWHKGTINVTEEQAYSLGFLLGDGCWSDVRRSLTLATLDTELIPILLKGIGCDSLYNNSDNVHYTAKTKGITDNTTRFNWLGFWDIPVSYAIDKKLPEKMLSAPRNIMSACISGLYDADGHCQVSTLKGGTAIMVGFTNTSEELVDQLHYILLHYGIVATKVERNRDPNWNTIYELLITGSDVKIFYDEIGFRLNRKQNILEAAINAKSKWVRYDHIPGIKQDMVRISEENRVKRGEGCIESRYIRASNIRSSKTITPYMVNCFISVYGSINDPAIEKIKILNNPDIFYDEIVEIGEGVAVTYDIHVPDGNEYCANGFFSHNSKIRGARFYFIVVDELAQVDPFVLDTVIRPMAATARDPMERSERFQRNRELYKSGLISKEELDKGNQDSVNRLIYASSGYFKFNHMWNRMSYFWEQIEAAERNGTTPKHAVWQIPYWDLPPAFLEADIIEESKNEMSDIEFRMEYCAEMVKDSEGFFKASTLEECTTQDCEIEIQGDPTAEYILGVDPNQGGSDNCGLTLIKVEPDVCKIVNCKNLASKETKNIASAVKKFIRDFNIIGVYVDRGGGGNNVSEWLAEDNIDGKPILTFDLDQHKNIPGRKLVYLVNFSPSWISDANFGLLSLLEAKKLLLPSSPKNSNVATDTVFESLQELKSQMLSIVVTENRSGSLHFDTPKKSQHKDLYSSLLLAAFGVKELQMAIVDPYGIIHGGSGLLRSKDADSWNIIDQNFSSTNSALRTSLSNAVLTKKEK